MSVTIRDVLRLSSLKNATVAGGHSGLDSPVNYVTVVDFFIMDESTERAFNSVPFYKNELVISSMADISDNVEEQIRALHTQVAEGSVGMLLYYVGVIVPEIAPELIACADALNFPLICMPVGDPSLRYSDAIREIMELIIRDENREEYFLPELLRMVISQPEDQRSMDGFLRMICSYLNYGLILTDSTWNVLAAALQTRQLTAKAQTLATLAEQRITDRTIESDGETLSFSMLGIQRREGSDLNLLVFGPEHLGTSTGRQLQDAIQTFIGLTGDHYGENNPSGLVSAMLQGSRRTAQRIAHRMQRELQEFSTLVVIGPSYNQDLKNPQELLRQTRKEINDRYPGCLAELYHGVVAVIGTKEMGHVILNDVLPMYIQMKEEDITTSMYICTGLDSMEEFRDAYHLVAKQAINTAYIYPNWHVVTGAMLRIGETCERLVNASGDGHPSELRILRPLDEVDEPLRSELHKTLAVFLLDAFQSVSRTAEIMYVHRNTIKYRLKRINELMGFPVDEMPESGECYLACAIERYLSANELSIWTNSAYHNCF